MNNAVLRIHWIQLHIGCPKYKEDMILEKWEVPAVLEMNVEETAGGKYEDTMEDYCAHADAQS